MDLENNKTPSMKMIQVENQAVGEASVNANFIRDTCEMLKEEFEPNEVESYFFLAHANIGVTYATKSPKAAVFHIKDGSHDALVSSFVHAMKNDPNIFNILSDAIKKIAEE